MAFTCFSKFGSNDISFLVIATRRLTADLLLVCAAANDNGCPSKRMQKYRNQTAQSSGRWCLKTDGGHHLSQKYPAGYCRAKKRDKVRLHIEFSRDSLPCQSFSDGGCHALFVSKTNESCQSIITDQALTPLSPVLHSLKSLYR